MKNTIKISTLGVAHDFQNSFLPVVIENLGYKITWVKPDQCDLLIYGPFFSAIKKNRWLPRTLRDKMNVSPWGRRDPPIRLFHTAESRRPDFVESDYSITFDIGITSLRNFRFPYWMEMIDWSHEGVIGNENKRYGKLLSLDRLMQPLGDHYLSRPNKAAFFTSHLREPRLSIYSTVKKSIAIDGYGPYFDQSVRDHNHSHYIKFDILSNYRYNLCPENGIYPGYYTEKIPEAFSAGCLPISFADEHIQVDFNPKAFINLYQYLNSWPDGMTELFNDDSVRQYSDQPLLLKKPNLSSFKYYIKQIMEEAIT